MKSNHPGILIAILCSFWSLAASAQIANSKTEIELITFTLMDYIDGTANGEPDRVRRAFHKDFNLYTVSETDSLRVRSGEK